jgi:hypothetical protein
VTRKSAILIFKSEKYREMGGCNQGWYRSDVYFFDEFLEEAIKSSSLYEADEDVDYEYCSSNHNAHATLSISNSLHNKCMNLLHLPEKYYIKILDGGADTCALGQGWEVLSVHNTRRANVVGFDRVIMRLQ